MVSVNGYFLNVLCCFEISTRIEFDTISEVEKVTENLKQNDSRLWTVSDHNWALMSIIFKYWVGLLKATTF